MLRALLTFSLGVAIGAGGLFAAQKFSRSGDKPIFIAVDGDTVKINAIRVLNQRLRAKGFDTPEIRHAKCAKEREAGLRMKQRLQSAIDQGRFTAELTGRRAGFGRPEAVFKIDGEDIAETWVKEKLAVRWKRGRKPDWCSRL